MADPGNLAFGSLKRKRSAAVRGGEAHHARLGSASGRPNKTAVEPLMNSMTVITAFLNILIVLKLCKTVTLYVQNVIEKS